MFCPECKYEYNQEISVCPDCNEKLVTEEGLKSVIDVGTKVSSSPVIDELTKLHNQNQSDDSAVENIDWVHLARLHSQQMADMLIEVLHAKGIAAVIHSETGYFGVSGQLGMSSYAPIGGGYSLFVDKYSLEDVDNEARIVIGEEWEKCKLIEIASE